MPSIHDISSTDTLDDEDEFALYSLRAGGTRRATLGQVGALLDRNKSAIVRAALNVRDFISTPVDGATSNQEGIAAAVSAAMTAGAVLDWPAGTYVSTVNIPNFHDVQHTGSGNIKRGADTWKIAGRSGTNYIYASPFGSVTNDGLSTSTPRTLQSALAALSNWPQALLENGTFRVQLAAGTYSGNASLIGLRSKNRIVIAGPPVGGHPNTPTAVIDGTGISTAVGLYLQANIYAFVQDIKLANWTYGATAYGMVIDGHCDATLVNVHAANCGYAGISCDNVSEIRVLGGIVEDCPAYGIRCYSQVSASIGYSGAAVGSSTIIRRCNTAVYGANSVRVHVDYCTVSDNATGLLVEKNSRAVANYTAFISNNIAVHYQIESAYGESGATNTFTANNRNYLSYASSDEISAPMNFWDRSTSRTLYGANGYRTINAKFEWQGDANPSGATYNTGVKMAFDFNGTSNYIGLSGPANSSTGLLWATVAKSAQATLVYNFTDDSLRFNLNGLTAAYRLNSTKFGPDQNQVRSLGDANFRWLNIYSQNIVLSPPAAATPANNGEMTFELTSNTSLTVRVKGSDGVVRSAVLALA